MFIGLFIDFIKCFFTFLCHLEVIREFFIVQAIYCSEFCIKMKINVLVTAEKPDLVIIDRMEEKMDIFELTVPLETNIKMPTLKR